MIPETRYAVRWRPEQKSEITQTRRLLSEATALRAKVSQGAYGDADLVAFWRLISSAGPTLRASSTELADAAGVGPQYFSSVARDNRRPKFANFLKALTAIIEISRERLVDVDRLVAAKNTPEEIARRLAQQAPELGLLASSLSQIARDEIARLDDERPNEPELIDRNKAQRELLSILANGLERISNALLEIVENPHNASALNAAVDTVRGVGKRVETWWKKNADDAVDWGFRLPAIAAGIGLLNVAGAEMTLATTAVIAMVSGPKVLENIRALAPSSAEKSETSR